MISKSLLNKKVKTTRVRRFKIARFDQVKFLQAESTRIHYFNYALQYLYQHYGNKLLKVYFPQKLIQRQFLIRKLIKYARMKMNRQRVDYYDYSVQSLDVYLMELIIAFNKYRRSQYKIKYFWSLENKANYLKTHTTTLAGFGRINYKHQLPDKYAITFKQQVHHHKDGSLKDQRINLLNNYTIKIPYLGKIHTVQSMALLKNEQITQVKIKQYSNQTYELQIVIKKQFNKHLSSKIKPHGMDVNSAQNKIFAFDTGRVDCLPKKLYKHLSDLDWHYRELQHYLNQHNNGQDNSLRTKQYRQRQAYLKVKISNIVTNWQLAKAKQYAQEFPILCAEDLHSFTMRISKRYKDKYKRKNINHKLALIKPTTFKQQLIYTYENTGSLLMLVNPFDTSKLCFNCKHIYQDLAVGQKEWTCPACHTKHDRDFNACNNIRELCLQPETDPILQNSHYSYLSVNDLVKTY